jgi:tRNA dimethylallyltransferase
LTPVNGTIPIITIVGPTASGKTDIGIRLAEKIGGEIISADSMQIYRWMDIGTAKPSATLRAAIPHHLIDILRPDQTYNAGQFVRDADTIIADLHRQGKPVILLGGTYLYLKTLVHGIISVPTISEAVREQVQDLIDQDGVRGCYQELTRRDPVAANNLHPNDISRLSRALAVHLETGRSIFEFQDRHRFCQQRYRVCWMAIDWDRDRLYRRINQRVVQMVADGLVEEAESLLWRGFSSDLPPLQAIGYRQAFAYLNEEMDLADMVTDIQQKSRRYAKKQLTWIRRNPDIHWLAGNGLTDSVFRAIEQHLSTADEP